MKQQSMVVNGILERNGRVLIARRSLIMKVAPGKYHLPGGHVEHGETPQAAIVREFLEEFAIEVEPTGVSYDFSYRDGDESTHGICFVLSWGGDIGSIQIDQRENDEIVWVASGELSKYFALNDHNYALLSRYFVEQERS